MAFVHNLPCKIPDPLNVLLFNWAPLISPGYAIHVAAKKYLLGLSIFAYIGIFESENVIPKQSKGPMINFSSYKFS